MSLRRLFHLATLAGLLSAAILVGPAPTRGEKAAVQERPPKTITNAYTGMKLSRIPAGKYLMGSPKEEADRSGDEQQHEVELTGAFYLGRHEVTQAEFKKVMGYNPSYFSKDGKGKEGLTYEYGTPAGGKEKVAGEESTGALPVENVSWDEAVEFCKKLSAEEQKANPGSTYRLPSEAEWEYACRGRASIDIKRIDPFHFGKSLSSTQANFNGNHPYGDAAKGPYQERTRAVGSYKRANEFGLHDMHGNVWEWCADWYGDTYYEKGPRKDPQGPAEGLYRVFRGGCWNDRGKNCRSARRSRTLPENRYGLLGFRVALELKDKE
jgi:formylglycine-generating enzyme required for sulfatase activity